MLDLFGLGRTIAKIRCLVRFYSLDGDQSSGSVLLHPQPFVQEGSSFRDGRGDLLVQIVLVPSEEDPSDIPSREVRRKRKTQVVTQRTSRLERHLQAIQETYDRLHETGIIDSPSSACTTSSC